MNCTICGQSARAGAMLCPNCKAALKRARQETISELQPLQRRGGSARQRTQRQESAHPASRTAPLILDNRRPILARVMVGLAALGATVVAAGYLGERLLAADDSGVARVEQRQSAPMPESARATAVDTAARTPMPAPEVSPAVAMDRPPAPAGLTKGAPKGPATPLQIAADSAASSLSPVEDSSQNLPPPPAEPAREAPPDRWQTMASAVARCGRDGFLARVMCEQRAWLEACEGYWGQVEQCPSGRKADYGQ